MFKVISAEIKKAVSKPGVYILAILLAVILILGTFIYKPKTNKSEEIELTGNTYTAKYLYFTGNGHANAGLKAEIDDKIDKAVESINNYTITLNNVDYSQEAYINILVEKFIENYKAYQDCINEGTSNDMTYITQFAKPALKSSLEKINSAVEQAIINNQQGSYSLISTKENYAKYKAAYKNALAWVKITPSSKDSLRNLIIEFDTNYKEPLFNSIKNFKYSTLSESFIKEYTSNEETSKLTILYNRLNKIDEQIQENLNIIANNSDSVTKDNTDQSLASEMDKLANLYVNTANTYINLVKYELLTNAFSKLSTTEQIKALNLSNYSEYNSNSLLIKYDYLFNKNKTAYDYNNPLTIGISSGNETNAYDYAYFVLRLFSFVIIAYSIISACHAIAGEIKEGSMRYIAIRPVNRTKLFLGKWLAIIIMSSILIIFSSIIALAVGSAVYGVTSLNILTIFNGNVAITMQPILMLAIYLLSLLLELSIYSAIAMLLSTLLKSDLFSVTVMLMLYLLNTLLPMFVQGSNSWLTFYPFTHISLYSMFGSSIYSTKSDFFNLLLGAKTYAGSHIALTLSVILIIILITIGYGIKTFKKKEL